MGGWNEKGLLKLGQRTTDQWIDQAWVMGLGLAAIALFTAGLGDVALRDWDEGIVAQVAKDIWRSQTETSDSLTWLYPTIGGAPYLNKPTLMHWLMAQSYAIGGVSEWTARLPSALLSAFSVPLLYCVGRELFPKRSPAAFAALVYLTMLPVVRHGRLAMLDGALVCFYLVMLYCLLRSRRDLRWGLGVGLGFGLMCLTKGAIGLLLAALALAFIYWDTPRLLTSGYLWLGMGLGCAPIVAWYVAQWMRYGSSFLGINLVNQSFSRLWNSVEGNRGPIWYYLLEILKYGMPWLVFLPQGYKLAWENRTLGWAKLVLVWSGAYLLIISLMQTKLPWYVIPIYPALALTAGAMLESVWDNGGDLTGIRYLPQRRYPLAWAVLFGLMAVAGWGAGIYLGILSPDPKLGLFIVLAAIALMFTAVTMLVLQRDAQFILVLIWGMYVSLLMLMLSPYWLWELQEAFPVKPVAEIIRKNTPPGSQVVTSYPHSRPSLNFYSDRATVNVVALYAQRGFQLTLSEAIARYWKETRLPYLLIEQETARQIYLESAEQLDSAEGWLLLSRNVTTAYVNHPNTPLTVPEAFSAGLTAPKLQ